MTASRRKPATFDPDDPRVRVAMPELAPIPDDAPSQLPAVVAGTELPKRRLRWGALFWFAASGLVALALGLSVVKLVGDLFSYSQPLGVVGLVLAALAGLALLAILIREGICVARLVSVDSLRERAAAAIESDDRKQGQAVVGDLLSLTRRIPRLARARNQLAGHRDDIIDGRDLVQLAERDLMAPLDAEARRMIGQAAKRVSIVTAVSPRAAIDILFVLINALALIRRLATLYGARPGTLGLIRLVRHVVSHLAVTGGMAVSDSLLQQVIGHGLAAKLSARLGEGVLNGLLTARLGLAAMDVTRPLPFSALPRPALNDLAGSLLRSAESQADTPRKPE
jgi:putative membrane protein